MRKVKSKIIRGPERMLMSDFQSQFSMSKTASESFQDYVLSSIKTFSLQGLNCGENLGATSVMAAESAPLVDIGLRYLKI